MYVILFYRGVFMRVSTSKSKNAESFYITKSYINDKGKSASRNTALIQSSRWGCLQTGTESLWRSPSFPAAAMRRHRWSLWRKNPAEIRTRQIYLLQRCRAWLWSKQGIQIEGQGFIPVYKRETITDELHTASGFRTDYQFITRRQMKTIQKKSKCRE